MPLKLGVRMRSTFFQGPWSAWKLKLWISIRKALIICWAKLLFELMQLPFQNSLLLSKKEAQGNLSPKRRINYFKQSSTEHFITSQHFKHEKSIENVHCSHTQCTFWWMKGNKKLVFIREKAIKILSHVVENATLSLHVMHPLSCTSL